ncbi:MAG: N-acetylglucosamine-6-phosphate deacetylase, partial [Oscillospiraceae bacterium]|nr:N-acetylglucosamine-6-phosphate deacetylase [Oscillospiraceae bacterium]
KLKANAPADCARIVGIHMEGPFFCEKKKGGQNPAYLKDPDFEAFEKLYRSCDGLVRIVDLAPELPNAVEFTEKASKLCTVSVAHTDANYEEACAVFKAGTTHLTHLFNAMPPIGHRNPSVIGAASENPAVRAELICDGLHVHPSAVRMGFSLFADRICMISDALRCCGMVEGAYEVGGQTVTLQNGVARLPDGTIAGAATNLYGGMKNAISFGISVEKAIVSATKNPAKAIGCADKLGSIAVGKYADFVVCDENLDRKAVYLNGKKL